MKVIAINGSPHADGTTAAGIKIMAEGLSQKGIVTEIVHIGKKPIRGCDGCGNCRKGTDRKCVHNDDVVNECIEKARTVDGIIIGSPVHFSGIAGSMKAFLDRFFYAGSGHLQFKVGAAFAALRRSGGVDTFHQLNNYFNLANIIVAPSHYWNVVHGMNGDEVMKDQEGVQILQSLAQNMAWLIEVVASGKQNIGTPQLDRRIRTNFIR